MSFTLDPSLMTGVGLIDGQHMNLVRYINELDAGVKSGRDKDILEKMVLDLVEYAAYHFADEERLMIEHDYPEIAAHQEEHQVFVERMNEFQLDASLDMDNTSIRLLEFLVDWLTAHIRNVDGPMAQYLAAHSAGSSADLDN